MKQAEEKKARTEIQCPIEGMCKGDAINVLIDALDNISNSPTGEGGDSWNMKNIAEIALDRWEKSLKRRKRAPETVGGEE